MRRDQAQVIRELRAQLGTALRQSLEDYDALSHDNAMGREMEDGELDEVRNDLIELRSVSAIVGGEIGAFGERYTDSLTEVEAGRIGAALADLSESQSLLSSAERAAKDALGYAQASHRKTKQEKLQQYMRGALAFLRAAWDSLFYATQKARGTEKVQLDEKRSVAVRYDETLWNGIMDEADARADESGYIVEVYDFTGALIYSSSPDVKVVVGGKPKMRWQWRPRPLSPALTFARALSTEERGIVREALEQQPGINLKELGGLVGVEIVEKRAEMTANPSEESLRHALFTIQL